MAIDGSFRLDKELSRFLHRSPKLASLHTFQKLIQKGENVRVEEVVNAVGQLVLHPKYTIPLVGCFRPIAFKIVDRAVSILRLEIGPSLSADSDDSMIEFEEDKFLRDDDDVDMGQLVALIDVYVRFGKKLNLHELACLAFSRALDLIPSLLGSVLKYFTVAPPPFIRIKLRKQDVEALPMGEKWLLNVARISYRFLLAKSDVFTTLWDWSCFMHLTRMDDVDTKWCAVQIILEVFESSDALIEKFGLGSEAAFDCLSRWQEFISDVSLEKASWYIEPSVGGTSDAVAGEVNDQQCFAQQPCSTSAFADWIVIPSSTNDQLTSSSGRPFVMTSAVNKSYEMVSVAVSQRWPVLLYGPSGSGKTALIKKLGQSNGSQVLFIHMDEQMDGKMLLGSYVCTEKPGEFKWQPGSLTQAVHDGFWVVFEDIDKAPPDIQPILLPLLEGATNFLTGYGEAIRVNEGFRLFSTVNCSKLDPHAIGGDKSSLGALWRRVAVRPSCKEDLLKVVHAWFPKLDPIAEILIETFEKVNILSGSFSGSMLSSSGSRFSLRDLLKWCKRINDLGSCFDGNGLSTYILDRIYREAVDIFASFSTKTEKRLALMKEIAKCFNVIAPETLFSVDKPTIEERQTDIRIGRVNLPLAVSRAHLTSLPEKKPFVEIHSSVHVLEKIASSVKYNEPVLLVGETGTGKTTLVQNLATRLGHKLTVVNLSQQSDAADLLGGFKPVNAQCVCMPLYGEFQILFSRTFSAKDNEKFLHHLNKSVFEKNWKQLTDHCQKVLQKVEDIKNKPHGSGKKRKRSLSEDIWQAWEKFSLKLNSVRAQISSSGMIFSFIEGVLVTALKNGEWLLLDEVNLAPPETLQRIIGVIEEESGSLCLTERGDIDYISRHSNFRIFACMNPATDSGKRDLPSALRGKFSEYYVDDVLNDKDLMMFINQFMGDNCSNWELVSKVKNFYIAARKEAEERLQDGANMKPQYSLRSLYRALEYMRKARKEFGFDKALYDGFYMFFSSLLNAPSATLMKQLISSHLLGGKVPQSVPFLNYLTTVGSAAENVPQVDEFRRSYVITKSVEEHLSNLARAITVNRYPVLLQGPTSSGKTSLVQYLAAITGHEFVRFLPFGEIF